MKYFVDGSAKGLAIGCGVVAVDQNGFMTPHSHHSLHPYSDSAIAELFAVDKTLDLIFRNDDEDNVIYVDRGDVQAIFQHKRQSKEIIFFRDINPDYADYVSSIRQKIKEVYRMKKTVAIFKKREDAYLFKIYENIAHAESRRYMSVYDDIYLNESTVLKGDDKLGINRAVMNGDGPTNILQTAYDFTSGEIVEEVCASEETTLVVDDVETEDAVEEVSEEPSFEMLVNVEWDEGKPYYKVDLLDESGNPTRCLVGTKHLVNVFFHAFKQLEREGVTNPKVTFLSPSYKLLSNLEKSLSYPRCPEDIRNKGAWIYEMIEKEQLIIA